MLIGIFLTLLISQSAAAADPTAAGNRPLPAALEKQVAVVIDDFGNGMAGTKEMFSLPIRFTVAVMPFMPTTARDAKEAHRLGHEVIVHMPMEPNRGKKEWLGPGAIMTSLSDAEIRKRTEDAIANIPYAVGMNNHMGSKVTADPRVMRIVLTVCKEKGLFFLDSRTTSKTVVPKLAGELGVPLAANQVFLDDEYSMNHIMRQIGKLRKHMESHEACIVIGHVGPPGLKTAAALRQVTPEMEDTVHFVRISELVRSSSDYRQIFP
jgi:polysaccharide deacetylase 2 family uncharacterized protein YibQ